MIFVSDLVVRDLVHAVSPELFSKYRVFFDDADFPETWIESAFAFKSEKLFTDSEVNPQLFLLLYPYHAFLVGEPNTPFVHEILDIIPEETQMHVDIEKWLPIFKEHNFPGALLQKRRFKTSHTSLKIDDLLNLKQPLPDGYSIQRVDRDTASQLPPILHVHIPPYFGDIDNFIEKGLSFCVKHGDDTISMAGSCIPYTNKLEVQIATVDSPEYRRKGFGTAAAIALLEYCLHNGIEPHWDATNEPSALMAKNLGYSNVEEYYVYKWLERFDG